MNEYKEIRNEIDSCLIIAWIGFQKERIRNVLFVPFLSEMVVKYGLKYIGIESANVKSRVFAEKLGFYSIEGSNYAISEKNFLSYFQDRNSIILYLFDLQRYILAIERQHQAASGL